MNTRSICGLAAWLLSTGLADAQSTAFSYQGRLLDGINSASGSYDLRFTIYDFGGNSGGNVIAGPLLLSAVAVSNGLFTVSLDFGAGVFNGEPRWLQIGVRTNGSSGVFITLLPRQAITATPYAIQAAGISGTLPDAQLSANVPRLNASNAFTGPVTFGPASGSPFAIAGSSSNKVVRGLNADQLDGLDSTAFWKAGGNAGTTPGAHFLGTTDNQPFELKVNGQRAMRLEPIAGTVNVIGGFSGNSVATGSAASTIAGGGRAEFANTIEADYSSIGGGRGHTIQANAHLSTIGGGGQNTIGTHASTISGGVNNRIETNSFYGAISGGAANVIQSYSEAGTVGGGSENTIMSSSGKAVIGGGNGNTIGSFAPYATIPGGYSNTVLGPYGFAAGYRAKANHDGSFVWSDTSTAQDFASTGPQQFLIRAIGGVGIGTTTPRARLDVNNDSFDVKILNVGYGESDNFGDILEIWRLAGGKGQTFVRGRNKIHFRSNLDRGTPLASDSTLTIDGDNVGIGTTSPTSSLDVFGVNPILQIRQNPGVPGGGTLHMSGAGNSDNKIRIIMHGLTLESASGGGGEYLRVSNSFHGDIAYFGANGNVGIGTPNPDARLDVLASSTSAVLDVVKSGGSGPIFRVFKDFPKTDDQLALTVIRNQGYVGLGIATPEHRLDVAGNVRCTTLIQTSDRNVKSDFATVNSRDVLERVASMPIQTWAYTNDTAKTRHIGPMAQDFHAAFGVGADDKHIATVDADGVSLAAIQGLHQVVKEKETEIDALKKRLNKLEELVASLAEKQGLASK